MKKRDEANVSIMPLETYADEMALPERMNFPFVAALVAVVARADPVLSTIERVGRNPTERVK